VLDLDAGTRASRADEEARVALLAVLYYVVAPLLAVIVAVGLFVLLRNWKRSPCYHVFTWQ